MLVVALKVKTAAVLSQLLEIMGVSVSVADPRDHVADWAPPTIRT